MSNPARTIAPYLEGRELPRYIVVEGPIGVGKTTLATKLADTFRYPVLLEPSVENPFLERFYRERRSNALPTQLYFLLHRAQQVSELGEGDLLGPNVVADYLIDKDKLFASVTLDEAEYKLYQQIHDNLQIKPPRPDLVIYLQAPAKILMDRIRRRGIASEQNIDAEYLGALIDAYTQFFHYFDQAPLLIVNASEIDFANNEDHFQSLLDQVLTMEGVRQYFNPQPTLL